MRKRGRVDANQPQMVKELRQLGYKVAITSNLGGQMLDLVVKAPGGDTVRLIEVKDPAAKPSDRKLTDAEKDFIDEWGGACIIALTTEDVTEGFK